MLGQYVDLVRDAGVRNFFVTALDNRTAAFLIIAFLGICGNCDVFQASRRHLTLPCDLLEPIDDSAVAFLAVDYPKSGKRGGAPKQHASATAGCVRRARSASLG